MVNIYKNLGLFESHGSSEGTVEITAPSVESIAGSVSYNHTCAGITYSLNGSFEVVHCAN